MPLGQTYTQSALAEIDRLRRERDAISAEFDAAQSALIAQRDAERDRADQLARELKAAQGERVVSAIFGHHKGAPRPFSLYRRHDVSGVSGTGVVALGAQWPDGTTVIRWLGDRPSTVVWESMEHAEAVHGHAGATRFVWLSDEFEALAVQEERETRLRDGIERIAARCEHNARDGWTGMASTVKALRALLDGPTPAPNTTQPGEPTTRADGTTLTVPDSPKMIREALCLAQVQIGHSGLPNVEQRVLLLQRLIDECDRHRPLGPDGKHGDRHTPTCGCEGGTASPASARPIYVDHEGKPTGFPRVEVAANVHIVPASPASSPTTDPATPDGHTGHTDTQEADRG